MRGVMMRRVMMGRVMRSKRKNVRGQPPSVMRIAIIHCLSQTTSERKLQPFMGLSSKARETAPPPTSSTTVAGPSSGGASRIGVDTVRAQCLYALTGTFPQLAATEPRYSLRCPGLAETLDLEPIPPVSEVTNRKVIEAPDPSRVGSAEVLSSHGCRSFCVNQCPLVLSSQDFAHGQSPIQRTGCPPEPQVPSATRQLRGLPTRELPNPRLAANNSSSSKDEEREVEFITESRKKLTPLLVALYACQDCHLIPGDNSEVNPPDVVRTDQLSEMYLCQNANRTVGNSDVNFNDFWVEPLKQKNCAGQIHNQLRLWPNVQKVGIYNFGKTLSQHPDPQWSSNGTVLPESRGSGAVNSLVPKPDKSGLPSKSVLPEPWAWRPDSVTPFKIQKVRVKNGHSFFPLRSLDVQLTPSIVVHILPLRPGISCQIGQ